MRKYIISSLFAACVAFAASAFTPSGVTVVVTPGNLSKLIPDAETAVSLVLSGEANAVDLAYLADMEKLETLDMSRLSIVGVDNYLVGTVSHHPANSIPANVFAGANFSSVVLPSTDGLTILSGAFAGSKLTSITIPSTVSSLGDGVFAGCNALTVVDCSAKSLGKGVFSKCEALKDVKFASTVALPADAFFGCKSLPSVSGDFTAVGDRAFSNCTSLTSFPFGSKLTAIGNEAFMKTSLKEVDLSVCPSLTTVSEWAFAMIPTLKSLKMGNVENMGQAIAFACPSLTRFYTSARATEIPDYAVATSAVNSPSDLLHDDIVSIGRYSMSGLSGISSVTLPASLEYIGDHAMENMTGLTHILSELFDIPELGEDVWAGINQADVELEVPTEMTEEYKSSPQWSEFRIVNTSSSADAILGEDLPNLRGRFEGDDLIVEADGVDIDRLLLYNPGGQLLIAVEPMEQTIAINTSGFGTRLYIIHATLADGRAAVLKLAR